MFERTFGIPGLKAWAMIIVIRMSSIMALVAAKYCIMVFFCLFTFFVSVCQWLKSLQCTLRYATSDTCDFRGWETMSRQFNVDIWVIWIC